MRQLSLVGFHGDKPGALDELLRVARAEAAARLGDRFRPYRTGQIHGTLIGLETADGAGPFNRNLLEIRGERRAMNLAGYLDHVRRATRRGLVFRIGGFARLDRPFLSRAATPYERGFSIQGDKVVLMGWPVTRGEGGGEEFPDSLDSLRRDAGRFGILHAYHRRPDDRDNDFYLRLGLLTSPLDAGAREEVEASMRRWLAERAPVYCELAPANVVLVSYVDPTLPEDSTFGRALSDIAPGAGVPPGLLE